jgi:DNA (cytosine-5)-methyltransferase 1
MNELALFAGVGGGLLASEILGWRTICAVELDWYCRCVLVKRQNERHLRSPFPIWDDIRTFDGRPWHGRVDIVSGGFPCQAYSTAASGKNNADDLWPEMRRVVADAAPRYVFAENVSRKAIDAAGDDLEQMGYKTKAVPFGAKDLGADHIRERYWLLAYSDDPRELLRSINAKTRGVPHMGRSVWESDARSTRVPDGMANRMERIKASGNGWVPVVAITALAAIIDSVKVGDGGRPGKRVRNA